MGASLFYDPAGLKEGTYVASLGRKPAQLCSYHSRDHPSMSGVALMGTSTRQPDWTSDTSSKVSEQNDGREDSAVFQVTFFSSIWGHPRELTKSLSKLGKGNWKPKPHGFLSERTSGHPGKESVSGHVIYIRRD